MGVRPHSDALLTEPLRRARMGLGGFHLPVSWWRDRHE